MAGYTAPKPDGARVRRHAQPASRVLPRGYSGPMPDWPLKDPKPDELERWRLLWTRPQATAWHELNLGEQVARYVRAVIAAEEHGAPVTLVESVRRAEDHLGLSPLGLARLRWQIAPDETAEEAKVIAVADRQRAIRDRLRPYDPAGA